MGAFATLVGLALVSRTALPAEVGAAPVSPMVLRWQAFALGDSCVFHVHDDALRQAFPLTGSDQFGNTPVLLPSKRLTVPGAEQRVQQAARIAAGNCAAGDTILLATDAISQWFLSTCEAGGKPWTLLAGFRGQEDFAEWLADARRNGAMRNDDVTVVQVRVGDNELALARAVAPAEAPQ